jgi:thimet oligopeptidase
MDKPNVTYPNQLRFDLSAEEITAWPAKIIEASKKALDEIASTLSAPTWEKTIQTLLDEDAAYGTSVANCTFFSHVHTEKPIRDASTDAEVVLDKYSIEKSQRYDVYLAVKAYVEHQMSKDALNTEQKYAMEQIMLDFKLSGMALPEAQRNELKSIKEQMSEACIAFNRNVAEDKTKVEFTREDLSGLSETVLKSLGQNEDKSKYIVTMKYPEIIPVLEKALNPVTRETLATANARRLMEVNVALLEKVLELRKKQAELLGFETPADQVLSNKMAPSPKAVLDFLGDLNSKLETAHVAELADALKVKEESCKQHGYSFDGKIQSWDRLFTDQLILARDYAIDHEAIAEYFPMQHVVQSTLEIYQELFGVVFSKTENPHVWHPEVVQYSVHDADSKTFIGHFYLDLHPRDGKYTHAAEFGLSKSCIVGGKRQHPIAAMVANFTKPTEDTPSLLRHNEVTTWAHELGHVLHELLGTSSYSPWSGTSTARDFVEAPSQALENWCFEREALLRLSKHHKTGAVLPDNLIDSLIRSKNANIATFTRRQIFFATYDMTLHTRTSKDAPTDTGKLWKDLSIQITKVPPPEASNGAATFGHIVGGYQACYYGYLWSEVFAADIFKQFKEKGIFNGALGRTYRNKVLAYGGSRSEMESLVDFLGREPNNEAFMEQTGLAPTH